MIFCLLLQIIYCTKVFSSVQDAYNGTININENQKKEIGDNIVQGLILYSVDGENKSNNTLVDEISYNIEDSNLVFKIEKIEDLKLFSPEVTLHAVLCIVDKNSDNVPGKNKISFSTMEFKIIKLTSSEIELEEHLETQQNTLFSLMINQILDVFRSKSKTINEIKYNIHYGKMESSADQELISSLDIGLESYYNSIKLIMNNDHIDSDLITYQIENLVDSLMSLHSNISRRSLFYLLTKKLYQSVVDEENRKNITKATDNVSLMFIKKHNS
ncbi:hypothetical protein NGRA_0638 [Nosema granulosis]|uniref:Secreted ookinete protein n=1 Tax=Nosema granulosis TaxID=83296 RepID=A0A9P6H116_9MICR|nr:hypothetical protein NGRA_0638 [Nosema granulosis]